MKDLALQFNKTFFIKMLNFCLLIYVLISPACKDDKVTNNKIIIRNPVAHDPTPIWPMQSFNARHSGNSYGEDLNANIVINGALNWVDTFDNQPYNGNPELTIDKSGNIYHMTTNISGMHLYKIRRDGTIIWSCDSTEIGIGGCGIALSNDETKIYYSSMLSIICRDSSGNFMWGLPTRVLGFIPVVGRDDIIYISIDKDLAALSPDGNIKWRLTGVNIPSFYPSVDKSGDIYFYNLNAGNNYELMKVDYNGNICWRDTVNLPITLTPIIDCSNNLYIRNFGGLRSVTGDGKFRWSRNLSTSMVYPSINSLNQLVTDSANYLICIDSSGLTLWKTQLPSFLYTQSIVFDKMNYIYLLYGDNNSVSICSYDNFGNSRWQFLNQIPGQVGPGLVLSNDGHLYCLPKNSKMLYCLN